MTDSRNRILLLETIDPAAMKLLDEHAEPVPAWDENPVSIASQAPVHAIVTRGKGLVTPELMDTCEGLRVIARCGVGLDNVDSAEASARGIPVLNLPGCNAQTIAEHTIMLMLAVARGLVESANAVRTGAWASRANYNRDELHGKTLGVVGLGNIGSRVANIAAALGMAVIYHDLADRASSHERVTLDDLLTRADVISLHCQLDEQSRGLLGASRLAMTRPGAIIINTARGGLIDHAALAEHLASGHLAGFGADVLDVEPPSETDPLLGIPHVVITPHIGSLTRSTYRDICVHSIENVLAVLEGRDPSPGSISNAAAL